MSLGYTLGTATVDDLELRVTGEINEACEFEEVVRTWLATGVLLIAGMRPEAEVAVPELGAEVDEPDCWKTFTYPTCQYALANTAGLFATYAAQVL